MAWKGSRCSPALGGAGGETAFAGAACASASPSARLASAAAWGGKPHGVLQRPPFQLQQRFLEGRQQVAIRGLTARHKKREAARRVAPHAFKRVVGPPLHGPRIQEAWCSDTAARAWSSATGGAPRSCASQLPSTAWLRHAADAATWGWPAASSNKGTNNQERFGLAGATPSTDAPAAANSWLFVPLLHAATGNLDRAASQQWETHAFLGVAWRQALQHLQCAPPIPVETTLRVLEVQQAAAVAEGRELTAPEIALPRVLQQASAYLPASASVFLTWAVERCTTPEGYIPATAQETLLLLFLGEGRAAQLVATADAFRASIDRPSNADRQARAPAGRQHQYQPVSAADALQSDAHVGGRQDQHQPMSAVDTQQSNAHEGGRQDQHQPVPLADAQQSNAHDGGRQDQHQPMPADDTQQSNAHEGGRQDPHQPVPLADAQQRNAHDGVAAAVPPPDGHPRRTDAVHSGVHRRDCGVATCPPGDPAPNQPEAPLHEPEAVLRDDSPTAPPLTHDALDTTEGPADGPGEPHGAHTRRFNPLQGARLRAAFAAIEPYDAETVLSHPCSMLRAPPRFLKGPLRKALRFALDLIYHAGSPEGLGQEHAWKIWLLLPRMLLFRHPGSSVPKREFLARFDDFFHGRWQALVRASGAFPQGQPSAAEAPDPCHRETGQPGDDAARRADRAVRLARLGELSAARQALMADPLAPGDADTLQRLTDPTSRPNQQYEPIPQGLSDWAPDRAVELLPECFLANLRRTRRGAAPGPSGLTGEMLRLVLDDEEASDLLWRVGACLARAEIPAAVVPWIGLGRMVAVRKPSGGVRGLVVGDVLRRLVSRTLAQHFFLLAPFSAASQSQLRGAPGTRVLQTVF